MGTSNHIKAGWTLFDPETEGAYCTAFSWHDDEGHMTARYRGNALFYTSMYSGLYDAGMAKNIPSAPMCACIEQMPVVSHADCVSVAATDELYELSFTPDAISVRLAASVTYGNCGNFIDHYATMASDEEVTDLKSKIVGECDEPRKEFLNDKFLVRGTPGEEYPVDTNNVLGVDFNLFSTYEDAENDENPWTFCNYNDPTMGFPRDCGPSGYRAHQWNRFYNNGGRYNVAYYVEKQ